MILISKRYCNAPGVWSHSNVSYTKNDVAPQEGMVEIMMGL